MGEKHAYPTYPTSRYDLVMQEQRALHDAAQNQQKDKQASDAVTAMHQHAQQIQRANPHLLPGAYPTIKEGMDPHDVAEVHAKLNEMGGMSPTQARDPALIGSQIRPNTGADAQGRAFPAPTGSPAGLPPARGTPATAPTSSIPAYSLPTNPDDRALLAQTHARDTAAAAASVPAPVSIPAGDPAARAFFGKPSTPEPGQTTTPGALPLPPVAVPATPANPATAAAAGTGQTVQTPYGTASSRYVPKGAAENPAVVSDTGVSRSPVVPWDVALVKKYPQIGVEGSPENAAFVKKYRETSDWAAKDPTNRKFDPALHAASIANDLFAPKPDPAAIAAAKTDQDSRAAFLAKHTPNQDDPESQGAAVTAPIGQALGSNPDAWSAEYVQPIKDAGNYVSGLAKGVLGIKPAGDPAPTTPAPPRKSLWAGGISASDFGFGSPPAPKPNPPYDGTTATAAPPVPTPPNPAAGAPPTSATTGASTPPPLSMNTGTGPYSLSDPNGDSAAFAQNPEEDQFRNQMREPKQISYAA